MQTKPLIAPESEVVVQIEARNHSDHIHGLRNQVSTYLKAVAPTATISVDRKGGRLIFHRATRGQVQSAMVQGVGHFRSDRAVNIKFQVLPPTDPVVTERSVTIDEEPARDSSNKAWQAAMDKLRADHDAEKQILLSRIQELEGKREAARGSIEPILRQKDEAERKGREAEDKLKDLEQRVADRQKLNVTTATPNVYDSLQASRVPLIDVEKRVQEIAQGDGLAGVGRAIEALTHGIPRLVDNMPTIVREVLGAKNLLRADADPKDVVRAIDEISPKSSTEADKAYREAKDVLNLLEEVRTGVKTLPAAVVATLDDSSARKTVEAHEARQRQGGELLAARNRLVGFEETRKRVEALRLQAASATQRVPVLFVGTNGNGEYTLRIQIPRIQEGSLVEAETISQVKEAIKKTGEKFKPEDTGEYVGFACRPGKGRLRDVTKVFGDAIHHLKEAWPGTRLAGLGIGVRAVAFTEATV